MSNEPILLKIFRDDPSIDRAPRHEKYQVPWGEGLLLLGPIKYVRDHLTILMGRWPSGAIAADARGAHPAS
jgi:hypothetical protein